MRILLDRRTRVLNGGRLLLGGQRGRAVRLSDAGAATVRALVEGRRQCDPASRQLAGRLVAAGLAHPDPDPVPADPDGVTVVVPVHGRPNELRHCLAALAGLSVIVVDDASPTADAARIAQICAAAGVRLLRLPANRGPGAARNAGLALVTTPFVMLVDSDVRVTPGCVDRLLGHLVDPTVALAAPRVRPEPDRPRSRLGRYDAARCPLDMGTGPAEVQPGTRVAYVPTAAVVVRTAALAEVRAPGAEGPFDPALRVGEDVDLVWRLHEAGWRGRYDPAVAVDHHEPDSWAALFKRRRAYGTSAAALATRHPGLLSHLVATPPAVGVVTALVLGRAGWAAAMATASTARVVGALGRLGVPRPTAAGLAAHGLLATVVGLLRGGLMTGWPLLGAWALTGRRRTAAVGVAAVAPALVDWLDRRPDMDPVTWMALSTADDLAYGVGVLAGCVRERTLAPLRPRLR